MSRNLCQTNCDQCNGHVVLQEMGRPITEDEAGVYFDEFKGMLVANAECEVCGAEYLAWINETVREKRPPYPRYEYENFFDLSYRSTFNDEPGDSDVKKWDPRKLRYYHGALETIRDDTTAGTRLQRIARTALEGGDADNN